MARIGTGGEIVVRYAFWYKGKKLRPGGQFLKTAVEKMYFGFLESVVKNPGGLSLLEIGPGLGHFGKLCQEQGLAYQAIDQNRDIVECLRQAGLQASQGAFPQSVPQESFDIVYASHVIEHCDTCADAVAFVKAAYGLLRPGGIIMLNFPNFLHSRELFYSFDYTHNFVTTPLRIENLLIDVGFDVVFSRETFLLLHNRFAVSVAKCASRLVPLFLWDVVGKLLQPSVRSFAIYSRSNCSVIALKAPAASGKA